MSDTYEPGTDPLFGDPLRPTGVEEAERQVEAASQTQADVDERQEYDEALERAAEEVARRRMVTLEAGKALDLSDIIEMAPEGLSPVEAERFAREAETKGRELATEARKAEHQQRSGDEAEAEELANAEADQIDALGSQITPRWILEQNRAELTEEQQQRVVDYWNDLHGTWGLIKDFETLAPLLEDPTDIAQKVVQAALLDIEPLEAIQFDLPGRDPFHLTAATVQAAQEFYGLNNDALIRLVRLSSLYADEDERIDELWQPMAALMAATNKQEALAREEAERQAGTHGVETDAQGRPRAARGEDDVEGQPDEDNVPYYSPDFDRLDDDEQDTTGTTVPSYLRGDDIAYAIDPTFVSFGNLRMYYEEGLERYNGSQALAFLHTLDRGLAARLAASGGDPGKVSGSDNAEAVRLLAKGGLIARGTTPFELVGGTADDQALRYLQSYFDGLYTEEELKAKAEAEALADRMNQPRAMPDPIAVAEQVKALWVNLFRTEPSGELINAFQQELEGAINAAPLEQNIDVTARIQAFVKGQPIYEDLYGSKPEGLTEQEYQSQFLAGAQSMLGDAAPDEEAILAGMRSGDYNATIGAIAGMKSSLDNSRFMERLTLAGDTLDEMT